MLVGVSPTPVIIEGMSSLRRFPQKRQHRRRRNQQSPARGSARFKASIRRRRPVPAKNAASPANNCGFAPAPTGGAKHSKDARGRFGGGIRRSRTAQAIATPHEKQIPRKAKCSPPVVSPRTTGADTAPGRTPATNPPSSIGLLAVPAQPCRAALIDAHRSLTQASVSLYF